MTTLNELQDRVDEINKLIEEKIKSKDNPNIFPITDGIIDINKYYNAKYKILWILKEPYDGFDDDGMPSGGDWDLCDVIRKKQTIYDFIGGRRTFKPMIYTSWSILNDFCLWDYMDNVEDNPTMLEAFKSIAYINIKKLPGYTSSSSSVIKNAYQLYKDILLKQIDYYNPDIVIGGSTLDYFFNDLGFKGEEMQKHESVYYIVKDNKIFIKAYHPSQRSSTTEVTQEKYCDDIITTIKLFF